MSENKRIIIYSNKVYALSEDQFAELSGTFQTAENLPQDIPLAAPVHVQAFVHSTIHLYEFVGNIDRDLDAEWSFLFKNSYDNL